MASTPRLFDCFTFFNENDVLAIRFEELYSVVDKFIIVHSGMTFRGREKPDYYDYERFKMYNHKVYMVWEKDLLGKTPWEREAYQRNLIEPALKWQAEPNDLVLISDVDEIPRRAVLEQYKSPEFFKQEYRLLLDKYSYGINMFTKEGNSAVRLLPRDQMEGRWPQQIRYGDDGVPIPNAGWEFSSLGTPEDILLKLKSFSHSEFDTPELTVEVLKERMAMGQDIVGRDLFHTVVEIDDTWPIAIKNNREYWRKYEW